MKLKLILSLAGMLLYLLTLGNTGQGITLSLKDADFGTMIRLIEKQSSYRFVYNSEQIALASKVSIRVKNASIEDVLEISFRNQPLQYIIDSTIIIISQKPVASLPAVQQKGVTVEGRVTNDLQEPLAGVSVTVTQTQLGTSTDANGKYVLRDLDPEARLRFSNVGYLSQEIDLKGRQYLNVSLIHVVNNLDESVVIGYGITTRRLNTGSVGKVSSKVIEQQPVSNTLAALQGRVAGLNIIQNTGVPGGSFSVQIRGLNSIANGNVPLYIVDGVPIVSHPQGSAYSGSSTDFGNPLSSYNPLDIESIEVLKDADATAIYGSRAANGVILITTKSGKSGKLKTEANIRYGGGKIVRKVKLLDTPEYLEMRKEAFTNDAVSPTIFDAPDLLSWDSTHSTDWQDAILGNTAEQLNAQLALSGGNEQLQFLLSGNYYRENTVFPGNFNYTRYNGHYSIRYKSLDKKFFFHFTGGYGFEQNFLPSTTFTFPALQTPPNAPQAFNTDGSLHWETGFNNPYQYFKQEITTRTTNFLNNLVFGYILFPGLELKANLGYNQYDLAEVSIMPKSSIDPAIAMFIPAESKFADRNIRSWIIEPQLNYSHKVGKLSFGALIGSSVQQSKREGKTLYATGFINDASLYNIAAASDLRVDEAIDQQYRYLGAFARINFLINNRYQFNLNGRRDGSSRFGNDRQFANFGSAGLSWILSEEGFLKDLKPVWSFAKIRMSYGTTGNDQIGDYQYLDSWQATQYGYQGSPGLRPVRLANPDYRWEVNRKFEIAAELGFFANRMNIIVAKYINNSSNQLVGYSVPLLTGFSQIQKNLPAEIENKGWEFEVFGTLIQKQHFKWEIAINYSIPQNELRSYPGIESSAYANTYVVGEPLTIKKNFYYLGVDPATGEYQFEDINNDGVLNNPEDRQDVVFRGQRQFGGMNNTFRLKNWELSFHFYFVNQNSSKFNTIFGTPGQISNQQVEVLNRWQKSGDNSPVQKFTQGYGSTFVASIYNNFYGDNITNASFVRLRNLSLSYLFSNSKTGIPPLKFYLECQNLFTISKYTGLDPELGDPSLFPNLRVIAAGISCSF